MRGTSRICQEQQNQEEQAAIRIQSLYRGGKDRKAVEAAKKKAAEEAKAATWPTRGVLNFAQRPRGFRASIAARRPGRS